MGSKGGNVAAATWWHGRVRAEVRAVRAARGGGDGPGQQAHIKMMMGAYLYVVGQGGNENEHTLYL